MEPQTQNFGTVPVKRPFIYDSNTESPSQPEITEPDDRKLLGQWYAQPDTQQVHRPSSANTENESVNIGVVQSQGNVSTNIVVSSANSTSNGQNTSSTLVNLLSAPLTTENNRSPSPTNLVRDKIFDIVRQGKPFTVFNGNGFAGDPAETSQTVSEPSVPNSVSPSVGLEYVGSYRVVHHEHEKQAGQGERTGREQVQGQVTEKRGDENNFVPVHENLASQLDIDKDIAMSHLDMRLSPEVDKTQENNDKTVADSAGIDNQTGLTETEKVIEITPVPQSLLHVATGSRISLGQVSSEKTSTESSEKNNSQNTSSQSKKPKGSLKVKFPAPTPKARGSSSPSKKVTMQWKKKLAMKAISDQETEDTETTMEVILPNLWSIVLNLKHFFL